MCAPPRKAQKPQRKRVRTTPTTRAPSESAERSGKPGESGEAGEHAEDGKAGERAEAEAGEGTCPAHQDSDAPFRGPSGIGVNPSAPARSRMATSGKTSTEIIAAPTMAAASPASSTPLS